ncbi:MAG: hypothetical protein CL912_01935 [Deltaproteobacteria bacterium]|nr:hypothetical protein [Deltaproteobacteria bacterium]
MFLSMNGNGVVRRVVSRKPIRNSLGEQVLEAKDLSCAWREWCGCLAMAQQPWKRLEFRPAERSENFKAGSLMTRANLVLPTSIKVTTATACLSYKYQAFIRMVVSMFLSFSQEP